MHAGIRVLSILGVALLASGCAGPSLWVLMTQSNFDYPNSNVVPMGHAVGVATRSYLARLIR